MTGEQVERCFIAFGNLVILITSNQSKLDSIEAAVEVAEVLQEKKIEELVDALSFVLLFEKVKDTYKSLLTNSIISKTMEDPKVIISLLEKLKNDT